MASLEGNLLYLEAPHSPVRTFLLQIGPGTDHFGHFFGMKLMIKHENLCHGCRATDELFFIIASCHLVSSRTDIIHREPRHQQGTSFCTGKTDWFSIDPFRTHGALRFTLSGAPLRPARGLPDIGWKRLLGTPKQRTFPRAKLRNVFFLKLEWKLRLSPAFFLVERGFSVTGASQVPLPAVSTAYAEKGLAARFWA